MAKARILVIDDEKDLVELLKFNLEKEGYEVTVAFDGLSGLEASRQKPDLIVLDLMLPKMDGLDLCRNLKNDPATVQIPILMLTAKGEETDIVVGLELGADDYLTKPFRVRELLARIKALLRRTLFRPGTKEIIRLGPLVLDREKFEVRLEGKPLSLTSFEFQILLFLAENKDRVLARRQILRAVSPGRITIDRTIDVHIQKIRTKLGKTGSMIETVRGIGYKIKSS